MAFSCQCMSSERKDSQTKDRRTRNPPTQAMLATLFTCFKAIPPTADPSEIPICSAELLKICCISDVSGAVWIK